MDIIDKIGADPLRFTLAAMAVHGRDVLLSDGRIEGYRNFVNKIWNAARFMLINFSSLTERQSDYEDPINQWIWTRFNETTKEVNDALESFRFFDACDKLYHFVWKEYCDWFIEIIKEPAELEKRKQSKDSTALEVLEGILKLLHPFMPFVTEEIYQQLPFKEKVISISIEKYPQFGSDQIFKETAESIGLLIEIVETVRSKRGESGVSPSKEIAVWVETSPDTLASLKGFESVFKRMCRSQTFSLVEKMESTRGFVLVPLKGCKVYLPLKELIEVSKEKEKVQKEIEGLIVEKDRAYQKLGNENFVNSAPSDVVAGVRERYEFLQKKIESLQIYLQEVQSLE